MSDARIERYRDAPIFGGLSRETLAFLLARVETVAVPAGEYFFREGWRGSSAFVLQQGRVAVLKHDDGKDHLLLHLRAGDCFGEMALLDFEPRSASVLADQDCSGIELTPRDLFAISRRDTEQFAILYMNVARELSRRLRAANERLFRAKLAGDPIADDYPFLAA